MAEKEERIYIECFKDDPCKNCDVAEVGYCVDEDKGHGCLDKSNYIYGMTHQDAIKKIEKHLIASTIKFNTTADVVAEIALNGLLEVE